jgi:hypothetical protein
MAMHNIIPPACGLWHQGMVACTTFTLLGTAWAQAVPNLTLGAGKHTLEIPYLELNLGSGKQAVAIQLDSTDLNTWQLNASSVLLTNVISSPTRTPATLLTGSTANSSHAYTLRLPYLEYSTTTEKLAFSVDLDSGNLTQFKLNTGSLKSVAVSSSGSIPTNSTDASPTGVSVALGETRTVGAQTVAPSTQLTVSWKAPNTGTVHHYEVVATESTQKTSVSTSSTGTTATLKGLRAATFYTVIVKACVDAACSTSATSVSASGTTPTEYWQLQGTGNTTAGLTKLVSDGNVRISATRFGSDAGTSTAGKIQLYYGPMGNKTKTGRSTLSTALTSAVASAADPSSYLSFTSTGGTTGLTSPNNPSSGIKMVMTGQAVPLSSSMGGRVRVFFEAQGTDGFTRIYSIDSKDGYVGQDFDSSTGTLCGESSTDYVSGGCLPRVEIAVASDSGGHAKLNNVRQQKVGFPVLDDWRWDGQAGTFMVFTADSITGCTTHQMNHGYAVWDGSQWKVQYGSDGCPKLFKSAQAAFPMHLGGAKYKMYYGDPSMTTGKVTSSSLPFLGPKKLIYADGSISGISTVVDFDDWEAQSVARDVVFLWPNGDKMNDLAEGYIDDYHFMAPTAHLDLQVMYLAITNSTEVPFGATAVLLNP